MSIVSEYRKGYLYYKSGIGFAIACARVINCTPRGMLQIVAFLTDDSRGVNYSVNMFIAQSIDIIKPVTLLYHYSHLIALKITILLL